MKTASNLAHMAKAYRLWCTGVTGEESESNAPARSQPTCVASCLLLPPLMVGVETCLTKG